MCMLDKWSKWIRKFLLGPEMTPEEEREAMRCFEALKGPVFRTRGDRAFQFIKEHGFPVRECPGERYLN